MVHKLDLATQRGLTVQITTLPRQVSYITAWLSLLDRWSVLSAVSVAFCEGLSAVSVTLYDGMSTVSVALCDGLSAVSVTLCDGMSAVSVALCDGLSAVCGFV